MPLKLKKRGEMWYAVGKIKGTLHRFSTEIPVGTRANREAAERRCGEIDLDIREKGHGWRAEEDVPTFAEWWETYRTTHALRKGGKTQKRDEVTLRLHALPFFAKMRLDEVKKTDCLRYLNLRRGAAHAHPTRKTPGATSDGTLYRERSLLQVIWQKAIEDGYDITNPWKGIERKPYGVRDRVLSVDEQVLLLAALSPKFQRFVLFLLGTGVRLDEVRHIDPARDLKTAQRFVTVTGKGNKTRHVPLPTELLPVIQQQLDDEGVLWPQGHHRLYEVVVYGAQKAGIPHTTPHTMRHTYGHRFLTGGGDIYTLSKILGHANVSVTEKHYAHLINTDVRDLADKVNLGLSASIRAVVAKAPPEVVGV